mmetsp:Transcript_21156/g.61058  ORF Transcript_21156/g.61058 Transcript_21156/m.61058 type:complete len:234 (+) Transcript_21156:180-881(+)
MLNLPEHSVEEVQHDQQHGIPVNDSLRPEPGQPLRALGEQGPLLLLDLLLRTPPDPQHKNDVDHEEGAGVDHARPLARRAGDGHDEGVGGAGEDAKDHRQEGRGGRLADGHGQDDCQTLQVDRHRELRQRAVQLAQQVGGGDRRDGGHQRGDHKQEPVPPRPKLVRIIVEGVEGFGTQEVDDGEPGRRRDGVDQAEPAEDSCRHLPDLAEHPSKAAAGATPSMGRAPVAKTRP